MLKYILIKNSSSATCSFLATPLPFVTILKCLRRVIYPLFPLTGFSCSSQSSIRCHLSSVLLRHWLLSAGSLEMSLSPVSHPYVAAISLLLICPFWMHYLPLASLSPPTYLSADSCSAFASLSCIPTTAPPNVCAPWELMLFLFSYDTQAG